MKYDNFTPAETKILNKMRELRELIAEYYPDNKHTSCAIIEHDACTYINITSEYVEGQPLEFDIVVWDKKGE